MKKLLIAGICLLLTIGLSSSSTAQLAKPGEKLYVGHRAGSNGSSAQQNQSIGIQGGGGNNTQSIQDERPIKGERQILKGPVVVNMAELARKEAAKPTPKQKLMQEEEA